MHVILYNIHVKCKIDVIILLYQQKYVHYVGYTIIISCMHKTNTNPCIICLYFDLCVCVCVLKVAA